MSLKNVFYFQSLLNSLRLALRNKIFWFLGIFAAFLGTGEWANFISFDFFDIGKTQRTFLSIFSSPLWENLPSRFAHNPWLFLFLLVILGLVAVGVIGFLYVAIISQGGLVYALFRVKKKKKTSVQESLQVGKNSFWSVLVLNIVEKYVIWVVSFLAGILTFLHLHALDKISIVLLPLLFFSLVLFLLIFSFLTKYTLLYIILKNYSPFSALKKSFFLFFKNFLVNIEVAVLLFAVNYIFRILILFVLGFLLIPLNSVSFLTLYFPSQVSFWFYFVLFPLLIVAFLVWAFAVLTAYNYSVWIDIFLLLEEKNNFKSYVSRLLRRSE